MSDREIDAIRNYERYLEEFVNQYEEWIRTRRRAIRDLEQIVADMDSGEFQNNVTQIVGSSVGVLSGSIMIGALLLAPFTAGASAAVGAGIAAGVVLAGGITNLTSDQINKNYALRKCKESENIILGDQKRTTDLDEAVLQKLWNVENRFTEALETLKEVAISTKKEIKTMLKTIKRGKKVAQVMSKTARLVGKGGRGIGMTAGKLIGKTAALALVGVGFDIWEIVSSSQDIANGSKSELGKDITNHIEKMRESLNEVQKYSL
ncbi:apolipoprotein L3-like [Saccostrea cucullata]|uniref:apolipoprotein L3-like n=1 Tax=Saccostrea cuccullata TaxID=36930 RepID=UPI002ED69E6A